MGVIYKIKSPSNKLYVGKTYDLRKRINSHKCCVRKGSNIILHNSIRKYGWENHVLEIIEEVDDLLLNERETFWIQELKTYCYENSDGMNMTRGGDGQRSTWMHKTDQRKKQSERFTKEGNPFFGKHHTQETKDVISEKASKRNKERGTTVPEWGAEKGRNIVRKPVLCYDKNGDFIKEFISYTEGGKFVNAQAGEVWASVTGDRTQCKGYHFRHKTENYPLKIDVSGTKQQTVKRPVLTLTDTYEIVCEHPSAQEASEFWGIPKTTINRAAMYNWLVPIRSGHVFIYTDLYAEILKQTA